MRSTSRCSHCSANASYTRARRIEGRSSKLLPMREETALSLGRIDRMRFRENGSRTMSDSAGNECSSLSYLLASQLAALYSLLSANRPMYAEICCCEKGTSHTLCSDDNDDDDDDDD